MVPPLIVLGVLAVGGVIAGVYANNVSKGKAKAEEAEGEGKGEFWSGLDEQMPMIIGLIGIFVTITIALVMYFKTKE